MMRMERERRKQKEYRNPQQRLQWKKLLTSPLNPRLLLMTASPHPVTALSLESRGAQVAAPHPRQHCSQNALEASARRGSSAAAAHTVVAPRQQPGGYNWAYYEAQCCEGKPIACSQCDWFSQTPEDAQNGEKATS